MLNTITPEIVVAYSQCPRKAFLLLCTDENGTPHEYVHILEQQKERNRANYLQVLTTLEQPSLALQAYIITGLKNEGDLIIKATLKTEGLEAYCDVLTRIEKNPSSEDQSYEPTIVIGTYSISKKQKLALLFAGYVLGKIQGTLPEHGKIIAVNGISHQVKFGNNTDILLPLLQPLQKWMAVSSVVLQKLWEECHGREGSPSCSA